MACVRTLQLSRMTSCTFPAVMPAERAVFTIGNTTDLKALEVQLQFLILAEHCYKIKAKTMKTLL